MSPEKWEPCCNISVVESIVLHDIIPHTKFSCVQFSLLKELNILHEHDNLLNLST